MFVCPKCKGSLRQLTCEACNAEYDSLSGIPYFLTTKGQQSSSALGQIYDAIYSAHDNVWEDQGREGNFRRYFADLALGLAPGSLLEVGCGEGLLLSAMRHSEKAGIDPSIHALVRAQKRTPGQFAAAQAEFLPFPDSYFNAVTAVGVMEHFSDPDAATRDILRVLRPGGAYIALIHLDMGAKERLRLKVREYLFPRFRPFKFAKWLVKKIYKPISQPMRRSYTVSTAENCLTRNGFAMEKVISLETAPQAPLAGKHVVILIARKPV